MILFLPTDNLTNKQTNLLTWQFIFLKYFIIRTDRNVILFYFFLLRIILYKDVFLFFGSSLKTQNAND
jgi:hypothetical protein